jgi:topoisomerase IV subunit B
MPVDRHREEGVSGVEVILTRLHAGAKFSEKSYRFSGGLHGVGVSVVNALSERLEVEVKRGGARYRMAFAGGEKTSELKQVGAVGQRDTGTLVRFWPDPKYFDTVKISPPRLKRALRAKAVLCPGLTVRFSDEANPENDQEWLYEEGLADYLTDELEDALIAPEEPFVGHERGEERELDWAVAWLADPEAPPGALQPVQESYVNLIPTPQGGTHVNGFRSGLTDAIREFCDFHDLLPRGVRLAPEDVWARCAFLLSLRIKEPQFSGQTKERLSNRDAATYVAGAIKDAFSLWLNQHIGEGQAIARLAIDSAQERVRASKRVQRKRVTSGPALPGKLADCTSQDLAQTELFLVEGDSAGGSAKQARDREFQAILPLRGKILNTWEVDPGEVLASQEVHDIAVALGVDPGSGEPDQLGGLRYGKVCILADADSDGAHIASLLCALFVQHFPALVRAGRVFVAMPPLYRIDVGKEVHYALDDAERERILESLGAAPGGEPDGAPSRSQSGARINVQRFKGLGEMNPPQLRETTMDPDTRRLVQLVLDGGAGDPGDGARAHELFDMLLAKKRAADRRQWLTEKGNLASTIEA